MHYVARPPGHWVRYLITVAGIAAATLAVTPHRAAAQCQNAVTRIAPCGGSIAVTPGSTNQHQTFTVYDLTARGQSFSVVASCSGYVTSCSASPTTANINPNSSTPITVTYSVSSTAGSGQLSLTGNGVTGYIEVISQHQPAYVTLPYYNYDNVQPSLCAATCFDKVAAYTTPPYFTMDRPRSVTLMYRSNTADPMITVQVDAWDSSTVRPAKMSLKIHRPASLGGAFVTFTNSSNEMFFQFDTTIIPERLGAQFAPQFGDTLTGAYNYTAIVTSYWGDGTVLSDSTPVRILLENERSSVFGVGWTVVGQQTIYPQSNGDVVVTDGAGAISYFTLNTPGCVHGCTFTSPTGDYTVLTTKTTDSFGRHYDRRYPGGTTYEFLSSGALAGIYDKNGSQTVFWYDGKGRDSLISDPLGTSFSYGMHFTYDSTGSDGSKAGRIRQIYDPYGRYTWFGVDPTASTLGTIEDPLMYAQGSSLLWAYRYNTQNQLIEFFDRGGNAYHTSYDFSGKIATDSTPPVLANGTTQSLVTQYQSHQLWLTNPSSGQGTSANPAAFHGGGPAWGTMIDPQSNWTQFTVDRWGQTMTLVHVGIDTTQISRGGDYYHMGGIPALSITYPAGGTDRFRYNAQGLLSWQQPSGRDSTSYRYGNNFAIPDTITGPNQPSQVLTVDGNGNVTAANVGGSTTRYYFDTRGRDTMMVDPLSHTFHYHYDPAFGNLDSALAPGNRFTRHAFDRYGRDSVDWVNGHPKSIALYDLLNRPTQLTSGVSGDTARFGYDSMYLKTVRDPKGQIYGTDLNPLGWPTRRYGPADAVGQGILYAYNGDGLTTAVTNRRSQTVNYSYDGLGRIASKSGTGMAPATYSYLSDHRTVVASNSVVIDTIVTDTTGWTTTESETFVVGGTSNTFHVRYYPTSTWLLDSMDITSSRSGITFPGRKFLWNATTGLLSSINVNGIQAQAYGYNGEALLTHITMPGSVKDSLAYTSDHQLYSRGYYNVTSTPALIDTALVRQYDYDSLGRVFTEIRQLSNGNLNVAYPQYDSLGHMRGYYSFGNTPPCASFDPASGYTCAINDSSFYTPEARGFDGLGNETVDSVYAFNSTVDTVTISTYGTENRIQTKGSLSFTTDPDGNVTRKYGSGRDTRYAWSPDGLMIGDTVESSSQALTYDYDALGRPVRRSRNGTVERYFIWSGAKLLAELDGTLTHRTAEYVYRPTDDSPMALITGATTVAAVNFFAQDALGNVTGVTSNSGSMKQSLAYLSQGLSDPMATSLGTFADTNRLRWKGLLWEGDSTRLYYVQARWYDPEQGRFMSEDPSGIQGGMNLYAFAGGDYLNGSDPSGLDSEDDDEYCRDHPGTINPYTGHRCPVITTGKPNPPAPPPPAFPPLDNGPGPADQNGPGGGGGPPSQPNHQVPYKTVPCDQVAAPATQDQIMPLYPIAASDNVERLQFGYPNPSGGVALSQIFSGSEFGVWPKNPADIPANAIFMVHTHQSPRGYPGPDSNDSATVEGVNVPGYVLSYNNMMFRQDPGGNAVGCHL